MVRKSKATTPKQPWKDPQRDRLILKAGHALKDTGMRLALSYGFIYSGGGVHVGPHLRRAAGSRLKLKFSFYQGAKGIDTCDVFHRLQGVLGGGMVDFDLKCNENWSAKSSMTCPSIQCKKRR